VVNAVTKPEQHSAARNPWILGFAAFFNDIASETLLRLLPVYLNEVLGAKYAVIGVMDGVAEASAALFRPIAGHLSDLQKKRKPWVMGGYGVSMLARLALLGLSTWPMAVLIRFFDRLGKGVRNGPKDALLAASRPRDGRAHGFSIDRALDNAGALLGLCFAAWLLKNLIGPFTAQFFRLIVLLAIVPGILAMLLPLFAREVPPPPPAHPDAPPAKPFRMSREFKVFLALSALFALSNSSDSFLLLAARQRGFTLSEGLLLFAGYNLMMVLALSPVGKFADRIGRRRFILAGWLLYGITYAGMALAAGKLGFSVALVTYGLHFAFVEGVGRALIGDLTPAAHRGRAYGIYFAVQGVMMLLGNLMFGFAVDYFAANGFKLALLGDAAIAGLAALGMMLWRGRVRLPDRDA
jgi:MFS family permease